MTVSVMITTKNRIVDLRRSYRILQQLDPPPLEILITADGCTDETAAMVKAEMPNAKLIVNVSARGSVASRHWMMHKAKGDLVLALDDDSYPEQQDFIERIVPRFKTSLNLAMLCFHGGAKLTMQARLKIEKQGCADVRMIQAKRGG